jgi:iron transport multicopper oxidase
MTANQTVDNYWIRANPNLGSTGFDGGINSAILSYSGANSSIEPTTNDTSSNLLYEPDLHVRAMNTFTFDTCLTYMFEIGPR